MTVSAIIIEDELEAQKILTNLLFKYDWMNIVGRFENADDALQHLQYNEIDLIFLDIHMPGKNVFLFLQELKEIKRLPSVIFTTAYKNHALEAIKQKAFDYLLKPIDQEALSKSLAAYKAHYEETHIHNKLNKLIIGSHIPDKIKINTRSGFLWINQKDILYCEADSQYTIIHLTYSRKEMSSYNLGKLEKMLTAPFFKRTHRSCLVNTNYLYKVDKKLNLCELVFEGKFYTVPLSKGVDWD